MNGKYILAFTFWMAWHVHTQGFILGPTFYYHCYEWSTEWKTIVSALPMFNYVNKSHIDSKLIWAGC